VIQSDNKIVAAGYFAYSKPIGENSGEFALVRFLANGRLDTGFANRGLLLTDMSGGWDEADAVAIQPDGMIVAGGTAEMTGALHGLGSIFGVARYLPSGKPDSSFSADGKAFARITGSDTITSLAIQEDGKVLAGGEANIRVAMVRWLSSGSPDASFGTGGTVVTSLPSNFAQADNMAVQADGRIVVAGGSSTFTVARFTSSGAVDTAFGISGWATTRFAGGGALATCLLIQPRDGKIVAFGFLNNMMYFEAARYLSA
jgi:uncharacterized delta-60 repeat protein